MFTQWSLLIYLLYVLIKLAYENSEINDSSKKVVFRCCESDNGREGFLMCLKNTWVSQWLYLRR
jgi:hypothetical protein